MQLSLSVRIAEGFLSKEIPILPLSEVLRLAKSEGYQGICLRASQVGVHSPSELIELVQQELRKATIPVSMVTGNFDIVYNNDTGPQVLRDLQPHLRLAQAFKCSLIRVALKSQDDIGWAQCAADQAAEFGIRLVHQCHTLSLFETLNSIETTLKQINRPNFGLIFEPANLQLCGQEYGAQTIERLAPWIFNVYLQNQRLSESGSVQLETWCRGPVSFDLVPIHQPGSLDFPSVLEGLRQIGYRGFVTVHQSATEGETPSESAGRTATYLRSLM